MIKEGNSADICRVPCRSEALMARETAGKNADKSNQSSENGKEIFEIIFRGRNNSICRQRKKKMKDVESKLESRFLAWVLG